MNDDQQFSNQANGQSDHLGGPLRSPIRPRPPQETEPQRPPIAASLPSKPNSNPPPDKPTNPQSALTSIRLKMETVANEFAQGKINRAQFNAMYGRYSEQRAIIERLVERDPETKAWKQVVNTGGHTSFLRQHFEAHPLYYLVHRHDQLTPMMIGGKQTPDMNQVVPVLRALWNMPKRPKMGLARKDLGDSQWMVLAVGEYSVTLVMFLLEPSQAQAHLVRDLHADFERANRSALDRGTARLEQMVFPQRALVEESL